MRKSTPTAPSTNDIHRQRLLQKRQEVLCGLGVKFDTLARMGRVAEDDQAQISHDEFVSLHLNSLDYGQLRLIEEALDRLTSGDYGICLCCEEPIAAKRLAALPWARYCVSCQEREGAQMDRNWDETRTRVPVAVR
ncbi:Transcriptional regulator, TraR/DksA family (modular protein) [Candidatus Sulfopaludibacter sp. SbA3]|nr:Transcriptional regulator, TraR/DksA family (modular protein) [Candidatus Sulfopaludibacter sp. SbA3]